MSKFKVGDICIVVKLINQPWFNGEEVTLVKFINDDNHISVEGTSLKGHWVTDKFFEVNVVCFKEINLKLKTFDGEDSIMRMFQIPLTKQDNVDIVETVNN